MTDFRLYGIFGFPLGHTLSPVMQEAAFRAAGVKAFYLLFEVREKDFRRLMKNRRKLLLDGFNVTVPYKEAVLRYLDGVDPRARAIGAVNTVVRKGRRWTGFNTDASGFLESLKRDGKFQPRGKQALILGAGGSARAVIYALAKAGAREITIANRTLGRARQIVRDFKKFFPRVEFSVLGKPDTPGNGTRLTRHTDLVVNATSVGLKSSDPALISPAKFRNRKTLFVDLIYSPAETRFLRLARRSGHRTLNGIGMLAHQGAEAFRLWTGRKPLVEVMRRTLLEGMKRHGR